MKFKPPRKKLTQDEIRDRLSNAYQSRCNYVEHIQTIRREGLMPLIAVLCHTTEEDEIRMCQERIAYLDEAIAWCKSQLTEKVTIIDFMG